MQRPLLLPSENNAEGMFGGFFFFNYLKMCFDVT
jgi:hypothetical protein